MLVILKLVKYVHVAIINTYYIFKIEFFHQIKSIYIRNATRKILIKKKFKREVLLGAL